MKLFFKIIRYPLGALVLFFDWLTRPKMPELSPEKRAAFDAQTENMKLYQFKQCPFCVKTRRQIRRLGLNIETRDARNDPKWKEELTTQGGKHQVPCLRVIKDDGSSEWIYESKVINQYLADRFQ